MCKSTKICAGILGAIACLFVAISPAYALSMEITPSLSDSVEAEANSNEASSAAKVEAENTSSKGTSSEKQEAEKTNINAEASKNVAAQPSAKSETSVQTNSEVAASSNIAMKTASPKNGWVTENGKVHYYEKGQIKTGWVVNSTYKNYGLQRYWMGAYGDLVSGGKIVNTDNNGYLTYCSKAGYVARNKFAESNGKFYLADNGGKLETTTGWLVTQKYDGAWQRYYLDSSFSVKRGEFWINSACYFGDWTQGFCFRNGFRVRNNEVWWADNGGVHTYYVKKCCNDDNVSIRIAYLWKDTMGGLWGDTARRAFDYVKNFRYINGSKWPGGDWAPWMAMEMLNNDGGNCYRYAALYTMMIRAVGFNANAIAGSISSRGGYSPHGWVEVYHWDGKTYVCDPDGAHELPQYNWYWVTYGNTALSYRK